MKIMLSVSWVFLAIEVLFVALMFANPNVGDDAAGRGMGRGFGIALIPVILLFGALVFWSQQSDSRALRVAAFCAVSIPFLIGAGLYGGNAVQQLSYRMGAAQAGSFSDGRLTKIARAIDRKDYALERALVRQGGIDWTARDGREATLLGHALKRVRDDYGNEPPVEGARILLAGGAPLTDSATRPDEHLMETVFGGNSPGSLAMLEAVLTASGDPNAKDGSGLPLLHTTWCTLEKLKVLAAHGADLNAPGNRSDRPKWSPLMNAAYMRQWDQALFLIGKGVPVGYRAPDGNTVESVLEERARENGYATSPEPGYTQLMAVLRDLQRDRH